jgi:hypothetical protein
MKDARTPPARIAVKFNDSVRLEGARSLEMLRAIERTLNSLGRSATLLNAIADDLSSIAARIVKHGPQYAIDPGGDIAETYDELQELVSDIVSSLEALRASAQRDPHICDEDGIVEGFNETLAALAAVYDRARAVLDAVIVHDAPYVEYAGPYGCADELIAAVRG